MRVLETPAAKNARHDPRHSSVSRFASRAVRWTPPTVVVLTVLVTGNHDVVDVLTGIVLAAVGGWRPATPMQRSVDDALAGRPSTVTP